VQFVTDFNRLDFSGDRSELNGALRSLRDRLRDRNVAGILLFTDGNATDELRPGDWDGLPPVYPVPIGSASRQRDLSVSNISVATTAFEDAPVTLQAEVSHLGLGGKPVAVKVEEVSSVPAASERPGHLTGNAMKEEKLILSDNGASS